MERVTWLLLHQESATHSSPTSTSPTPNPPSPLFTPPFIVPPTACLTCHSSVTMATHSSTPLSDGLGLCSHINSPIHPYSVLSKYYTPTSIAQLTPVQHPPFTLFLILHISLHTEPGGVQYWPRSLCPDGQGQSGSVSDRPERLPALGVSLHTSVVRTELVFSWFCLVRGSSVWVESSVGLQTYSTPSLSTTQLVDPPPPHHPHPHL